MDGARKSGLAISCRRVNAPLPAGLPAGGRGTGRTMIGAKDAFGVYAGNLGINYIRCRNFSRRLDKATDNLIGL